MWIEILWLLKESRVLEAETIAKSVSPHNKKEGKCVQLCVSLVQNN